MEKIKRRIEDKLAMLAIRAYHKFYNGEEKTTTRRVKYDMATHSYILMDSNGSITNIYKDGLDEDQTKEAVFTAAVEKAYKEHKER